MNDFLDAAAIRSARAAKALSRSPFGAQARRSAIAAQAAAAQARSVVDPIVGSRVRAITDAFSEGLHGVPLPTRTPARATWTPARTAKHPSTVHGPLQPHLDGPGRPGDGEMCTCQGIGDAWCGATKRDVVHDLMNDGMHLDREQAENLWKMAQSTRAADAAAREADGS